MSTPRVHNKKANTAPPGAVYVGRPTKWGNPFSHQPTGTLAQFHVPNRETAVQLYAQWIQTQPELMNSLDELKGKDLVCWCYPLACHANVLMNLSNTEK